MWIVVLAATDPNPPSLLLSLPPDVAVLGEITLSGVLWPLEQVNEAEVRTAIDANISLLILPMVSSPSLRHSFPPSLGCEFLFHREAHISSPFSLILSRIM